MTQSENILVAARVPSVSYGGCDSCGCPDFPFNNRSRVSSNPAVHHSWTLGWSLVSKLSFGVTLVTVMLLGGSTYGQSSNQLAPGAISQAPSQPQRQAAPTNAFEFPDAPITFDPNVRAVDHLDRTAERIQQNSQSVDGRPFDTEVANLQEADPWADVSGVWNNLSSVATAKWNEGGWSNYFQSLVQDADLGRMLGSLALVLGGYFGLVWLLRVFNGGASGQVPTEVLELLGTVPLAPRKQLQIVRLGSKLLLLVDGEDGTHPIGEISDPAEVEYLASLCPGRKKSSGGSAIRIREAAQGMLEPESRSAATPPATTTVNVSPAPVVQPTPVAPPAPTPAAAPPPASATAENHLAAILQALNGPRNGNATVFEA